MPARVIEWSEHFETGVASVDAQHRRLIELANELGEAIVEKDESRCDHFCAELGRYALEHFADEEDISRAEHLFWNVERPDRL